MVPRTHKFIYKPSKHRCTLVARMISSIVSYFLGVAMRWFLGLPPRSISSFLDPTTAFVSQFAANQEKCLEVVDLFNI
ncbi:hypothetical protein CR513_36072, partial [Mucuna pruriens]